MIHKLQLFFIISILQFSLNLYSNTIDESKLRVFNEDTVYFLGYDFSFMKFTYGDKLVRNKDVAITIDAWIGYQKLYITPQTTLKRWLRIPTIEMLPCYFGCQCDEDKNWLTNKKDYSVPMDSIQHRINSYDLPIEKGIGLVVHIINLNKPKEMAYARFTFFDMATGKVLWSELANGKPDEHGFNKYWGHAIHYSVKDFVDYYYKPEYNRLIIYPQSERKKSR